MPGILPPGVSLPACRSTGMPTSVAASESSSRPTTFSTRCGETGSFLPLEKLSFDAQFAAELADGFIFFVRDAFGRRVEGQGDFGDVPAVRAEFHDA